MENLTPKPLLDLFLKLVRIDSPTGHEQELAKYILHELREIGYEPRLDQVGNVFLRVDGVGEPLFLAAHMDTVEPGVGIETVIEDGIIRPAGKTILGADNKASLACLLYLLNRRAAQADRPWRPLEVLFTVAEEEGGDGAAGFDYSQITAREGYVFDAGEPVGQVTTASPFYGSFDIKIKGEAMHAAYSHRARPTLSIALELVKTIESLRAEDVAVNIGRMFGGSARNTVIGSMRMQGEIRVYDEAKFQQAVAALEELCERDWGVPVFLTTRVEYKGYQHPDQLVKKTVKKIESILGTKVPVGPSFGCSDANAFNNNGSGLQVFDIGDGVFDGHTYREHIRVEDLGRLATLVQGLAEGPTLQR